MHERLSTKAILETLRGHRRDRQFILDLFGNAQHPIHDQVLRAYEHPDRWVNRLVLGDSLVVMNSLLHYESLGGQVQMIYMDPPYGVRFGSNFQPFVRKRDVSHNDDSDMTREPEMVKAYRDTWDLGLHSYLTYLRDRLLLCRDLLAPSGSIFVQINDEHVHQARGAMDEIFGEANFISTIVFQKTSSEEGEGIANTADYLLWYCRDRDRFRSFPLLREKRPGEPGAKQYVLLQSPDGKTRRKLTPDELANPDAIAGGKVCRIGYPLTSQHYSPTRSVPFAFEGEFFSPGPNRQWSIDPERGLRRLVQKGRVYKSGSSLSGIMFLDDAPGTELGNVWLDTGTGSFTQEQIFVVQTSEKVIERCVLMATEPGGLVLDPTCGSGTTAHAAEKWGRRWIAIDTSRVPLALTRQRLLCATYPFFRLKEEARGPAGGLDYQPASSSRNRKADGVGVRVQHSLVSLADEEPPKEIVFRQNPEIDYSVIRVTGPFCVEATIPTPVDWEGDGVEDSGVGAEEHGSFVDRMLEVLRKSPVLHVGGGKTVVLRNVRPPAKTLSLSAEAIVPPPGEASKTRDAAEGEAAAYEQPETEDAVGEPRRGRKEAPAGTPVALVFGPESGAVSEKLVYEAAREAFAKGYAHLYVIGFAIQPNARELVEKCEAVVGVPGTYVQATPDLMMGDLLKNMRSSQIFSVCGLPEVEVRPAPPVEKGHPPRYEVELKGLDVFDPATMEADHRAGADVPAWLLDTDYNGLCFHVCQAFFPRTAAWDDLRRSLKGEFEDSVWEHLAGTTSAPFEAGEHREVAVKVIDDRGNELLVVKPLKDKP